MNVSLFFKSLRAIYCGTLYYPSQVMSKELRVGETKRRGFVSSSNTESPWPLLITLRLATHFSMVTAIFWEIGMHLLVIGLVHPVRLRDAGAGAQASLQFTYSVQYFYR